MAGAMIDLKSQNPTVEKVLTWKDKDLDVVHLPTMNVKPSMKRRLERHGHTQRARYSLVLSPIHPQCTGVILVPTILEFQGLLINYRAEFTARSSGLCVDRSSGL